MQLIINILLDFSLYLLISISFWLIYNQAKFFHIAHASVISLSSYFIFLFIDSFFISLYCSIILSIVLCILIGILMEFLLYKYMRKEGLNSFAFLICSIGLYIVLQNCISLYFGDDTKIINKSEIIIGHEFFGAYITTIQTTTIVASLLIFTSMYLFYNYSTIGKQIKAVSENLELATVYGISSTKIILICFGLGSGIGAIAGILSTMDNNLTPNMGFNLLFYGIVAMIIGGVGSFRGLVFGSLLVATAQNLVAYYLDTKWMDAATYIILIAFLLWKPLGFSGKRLKKIDI